MTLTAIFLIIILGIILLLVEILVIPGFGIPGIIGIILIITGIFFSYRIDNTTGHLIFAGSFILSVALILLSLRAKTWNRLMLKAEISGKTNTLESEIKPGDTGVTISRFAPMGKAKINDQLVEASSQGEFISENVPVQVIKAEGNKIIVKPVN